jgi:hypothetical protein
MTAADAAIPGERASFCCNRHLLNGPSPSAMALLEIQNVTRRFGESHYGRQLSIT